MYICVIPLGFILVHIFCKAGVAASALLFYYFSITITVLPSTSNFIFVV